MSSNIDKIIDEIEDYIDNCKYRTFSSTEIIVNKDEMQDLIRDLRQKTPEEVKRYQKIISNKEAILADAQEKADAIIAQAQMQKEEMIRNHQISQQAAAHANDVLNSANMNAQAILSQADADANAIRLGALRYADVMLKDIEEFLSQSKSVFKTNFTQLETSMQNTLSVVMENRKQLQTADQDNDKKSKAAASHKPSQADKKEANDSKPAAE